MVAHVRLLWVISMDEREASVEVLYGDLQQWRLESYRRDCWGGVIGCLGGCTMAGYVRVVH